MIRRFKYEINATQTFGRISAFLEEDGTVLPDADIQIAATALGHGLERITVNLRRFQRMRDLI
jgi:predicted nucleic acid-binding protein